MRRLLEDHSESDDVDDKRKNRQHRNDDNGDSDKKISGKRKMMMKIW